MKLFYLLHPIGLLGVVVALLLGCEAPRPPLSAVSDAMRLAETPPSHLEDDIPLNLLASAIEESIAVLEKRSSPSLQFGEREIPRLDYIAVLKYVLDLLAQSENKQRFLSQLHTDFDFLAVYGKDHWGELLLTSYYDPVINGSLQATDQHSQALYAMPNDLVEIQLGQFKNLYPQLRLSDEDSDEQSSKVVLRGRIQHRENRLPNIVPYYSRENIDDDNALLDRGLELVWVDPIDAFFLQIQGSGIIKLTDGTRLRLGYAAQNGHPYIAIGKHLTDVIPLESMSAQKIKAYLRSLTTQQRQDLLNLNPSYVFFRKLSGKSITYSGAQVTAGRTIATDYRYFPKGALAYLQFDKPSFSTSTDAEEPSWSAASRLVLDQDTGGAIRGGYRADLYWGEGDDAARHAGVMKSWGKLFYLFPKPELLLRIQQAKQLTESALSNQTP